MKITDMQVVPQSHHSQVLTRCEVQAAVQMEVHQRYDNSCPNQPACHARQ
jgi:hypothetical protein